MKTLRNFLLLLVLCPLFSWAQSNYKSGFVVTAKGDTVRGFIDYQGWDSNPTSINFKTATSDHNDQKFTLNDISFFSVDGITAYQKFAVSISMDETNTSHLVAGRDTGYRNAEVFLQVLQKGKNVVLYSYQDDLKLRFYLGETPSFTPAELEYRVYDVGGATTLVKGGVVIGNTVYENVYLKTLFALVNKYSAMDDNLNRTFQSASYKKDDILLIVSKINQISTDEYQKKYAAHTKINFYASGALNIATTSSSSVSSYSQGGGPSSTSYLPAFALGINIDPNPTVGKVELRADISVRLSKENTTYKLTVTPYGSTTASFNETTISFTPQIIYNFYNANNFKIYVGLGFALNHSNFSNTYFGPANNSSTGGPSSATEPFAFNGSDNAFVLKAGFKLHSHLEVFFNYYTSEPTTAGGYFSFNNTTNQLGLSYFFGR
jgi:hypothetical protein